MGDHSVRHAITRFIGDTKNIIHHMTSNFLVVILGKLCDVQTDHLTLFQA
jgi:hypothetical protein